MDWLLRPVVKNMVRFESLKNGSIDLDDIALMNEALDVVGENTVKAQRIADAR